MEILFVWNIKSKDDFWDSKRLSDWIELVGNLSCWRLCLDQHKQAVWQRYLCIWISSVRFVEFFFYGLCSEKCPLNEKLLKEHNFIRTAYLSSREICSFVWGRIIRVILPEKQFQNSHSVACFPAEFSRQIEYRSFLSVYCKYPVSIFIGSIHPLKLSTALRS